MGILARAGEHGGHAVVNGVAKALLAACTLEKETMQHTHLERGKERNSTESLGTLVVRLYYRMGTLRALGRFFEGGFANIGHIYILALTVYPYNHRSLTSSRSTAESTWPSHSCCRWQSRPAALLHV